MRINGGEEWACLCACGRYVFGGIEEELVFWEEREGEFQGQPILLSAHCGRSYSDTNVSYYGIYWQYCALLRTPFVVGTAQSLITSYKIIPYTCQISTSIPLLTQSRILHIILVLLKSTNNVQSIQVSFPILLATLSRSNPQLNALSSRHF